MKEFITSPDCPIGGRVDDITAVYIGLRVLHTRGTFMDPVRIDAAKADSDADFREIHTQKELELAQTCADTIAKGNCPFYDFDPEAGGVVPTEVNPMGGARSDSVTSHVVF